MIRGICEKKRLIDLVENFTLFDESRGGLVKITGKNHQYLGVKAQLDKGRKRTEAEKLKKVTGDKLLNMVNLNKTRTDLMEKFKKLIDEYNNGMDVESFMKVEAAGVRDAESC